MSGYRMRRLVSRGCYVGQFAARQVRQVRHGSSGRDCAARKLTRARLGSHKPIGRERRARQWHDAWFMTAAGAAIAACVTIGAMAATPASTRPRSRSATPCRTADRFVLQPDRQVGDRVLQHGRRTGRRCRAQNQFHLAGQWLQPSEDRRAGASGLVEEDQVAFLFNTLGTPTNFGDRALCEPEEGAAPVRRDRCGEVGR